MSAARVGIIGVGNMGSRIARRIMAAGNAVVAYDLEAARIASCGASHAASVGELVGAADVILLSLPDSSVIEGVVLGGDGVEASCRHGQTVVDLSTASPESTRLIHRRLRARGVEFLDAGISGGPRAAEAGTLILMVGGSAEALELARPVLDHFSARIFHMGATGTGHITKVLNNYLNAMSLAATSETMVAARKEGLDLERLLEVLNSSTGANYATLHRFPDIVRGDYLEGGLTGELMAKDLRLYLDYMARMGVPTFNAPACLAMFELMNASGYGESVSNRIVDGLGDMAGGIRLQDGAQKGRD